MHFCKSARQGLQLNARLRLIDKLLQVQVQVDALEIRWLWILTILTREGPAGWRGHSSSYK